MTSIPVSINSSKDQRQSLSQTRLLLRAVALLLAFAAITKAYAAWHDGVGPLAWFQVMAEFGLSLWLLSGIKVRIAWVVTLVAFVVFAAITAVKAYQRVPDCGCFGHQSISPTATLCINLATLVLLFIAPPQDWKFNPSIRERMTILIVALVVGIVVVAFAWHRSSAVRNSNSVSSGTAAIPSTSPSIQGLVNDPRSQHGQKADFIGTKASSTDWLASIGSVTRGKAIMVLFQINSPRQRSLQIRGVNVACSCTNVRHPPRTIPSMGTTDVQVDFHVPDHASNFESDVFLTTDDPQLPPLKLVIKGVTQ